MTKNEEKKETKKVEEKVAKEACACGCSCKKKAAVLLGVILVAAALAFGACRVACCQASKGSKVMVIDFERVRQEAEAYKSILSNQRAFEEKLQAKLSVDAGQLQKEEKELNEKKGKISEAEFKKKALSLQQKATYLQEQYQFQARQILLASQIVAEKIQGEVQQVLDEVAQKKGANIVVNKNIAIYTDKTVDMTDCFVKALNEKVKAKPYPKPDTIRPVIGGGK